MNAALYLVGEAVGGAICASGVVLLLGGALAMLRFPDVYTRLHGALAADGAGALLVLLGLAIASGDAGVAIRLLLLGALLMAMGPTMTHLVANAAHVSGVTPVAGAYAAPRPGAPRSGRQT